MPAISYTNIHGAEIETGHADANGILFNSSTRVYHWVVSDFASRRENCQNQEGHPAGSPGLDCSSPRKSTSIAPWVNGLPIYVSFQKFAAEIPKYDAILSQFGRSSAQPAFTGDDQIKAGRKWARTLVGPIAKKVFQRFC